MSSVPFLAVLLTATALAQPSRTEYDAEVLTHTSAPIVTSRSFMAVIEFAEPVERFAFSRNDLLEANKDGNILFLHPLADSGETDLVVWHGGRPALFKVTLTSGLNTVQYYAVVPRSQEPDETLLRPAVPRAAPVSGAVLSTPLRPNSGADSALQNVTFSAMVLGNDDGHAIITYMLSNLLGEELSLLDLKVTVNGEPAEFLASEGEPSLAAGGSRAGRVEVQAAPGSEIGLVWTLQHGEETIQVEKILSN